MPVAVKISAKAVGRELNISRKRALADRCPFNVIEINVCIQSKVTAGVGRSTVHAACKISKLSGSLDAIGIGLRTATTREGGCDAAVPNAGRSGGTSSHAAGSNAARFGRCSTAQIERARTAGGI